MPAITAPRGTQDILPDRSPRWEWILRSHADLAQRSGYALLETPIFEATELFERGTGAGTDVVEKEMYTFRDRGDRSITLRPETTPSAVRAVLQAHLDQETRPVRVRYAGPQFRYDRPQAGRYRQFWQVGVEAIGEHSPGFDVEVVDLAWRYFQSLGIEGISLQLNTLGDLDDRTRYRAALVAYYTPHRQQLCDDCTRRLEINPLRLLDCKRDSGLVAGAPDIAGSLSAPSREFFERVQSGLRGRVPYRLNPRLVRGLDYYAHTTFEVWHESLQGAQNALGGGGRYDGLAAVLGFPSTPGVGYALGVERILHVCETAGLGPNAAQRTAITVISLDAASLNVALGHADQLRGAGREAVVDASDRRLDRRLRNAERSGSRVAVIVGSDEARDGTITVRDLVGRSQTTTPAAALGEHVDAILRKQQSDA
ncbi:MAG: histidine--tRNA ligase [Candidatus Dormibacteria bacterium]